MRRRPPPQPSSLTSLLDTLFIIVFASLVHSSAVDRAHVEARAAALARSRGPAPPTPKQLAAVVDRGQLKARAVDQLDRALAGRTTVIARVGVDGLLTTLEVGEPPQVIGVGVPLVARVDEPDVLLAYRGDRDPATRLCPLIATALGATDLRDSFVVVTTAAPLSTLSVALVGGLRRDADRCAEQHGVAVVLDLAIPSEAP